ETAEAFADEQCDLAELARAKLGAWRCYCELAKQNITEKRPHDQERSHVLLAAHAAGWVAHKEARGAAQQGAGNVQWIKSGQDQVRLICQWLRDLFGNPFRPASIDPHWLHWNDTTVVKIAQSIYVDRAFNRLPILADALEDAGCGDADILAH